ncbi:MAG: EAL domain-containing protein [Proteobacteria bacterium]|nr:EAL domain-containing protein [Pseudomonadota bacterium]MBU1594016.1 EAL domain-containing protein [Pseudomonadota bacterium]
MTLRKATLLLTGLLSVALLAVLLFATRHIIDTTFLTLEQTQTRKNVERAKNAVADELQKLDDLLVDWAVWDDTLWFMQGRGKDFASSNLNARTLASLRLSAILFIRSSGRVALAQGVDPATGATAPLPEGLLDRLQPGSLLLAGKSAEDRIKGLVLLPQGVVLLAACPILSSEAAGPSAGTLVMVRPLGGGVASALSERIRLPLALERADSPLPPDLAALGRQTLGTGEIRVLPLNRDLVAGTAVMPDVWGAPALRLIVREPREIMALGDEALTWSSLWMSVCGLLFLGAIFVFLERRVLWRMTRLREQVEAVNAGGETLGRVDMPGSDELSALAGRINAMLGELERSRQGLATQCAATEAQEQYLQHILDSIHAGVMLVDPQTCRIMEVNAFAAAFAGRTREQIIGRVCHGFVCPTAQGHCPVIDQGLSGEQTVRSLLHADGSTRAILKSVSRIDRGGKPILLETFIDVDDLLKAQDALKRSEEMYRTLFMNTGTATVLIEDDTTISLANQEFEKLAGVPREQIEGRMSWTQFFAPEKREMMMRHHVKRRISPDLAPRNYETDFTDAEGQRRIIRLTVAMLPGTKTSVAALDDITEQKIAEEQLRHQAFHDALTGLPNRLLLLDRLERSVVAARREGQESAVLLMDLDRFKDVNDSLGHSLGDRLLQQVAQRLSACVRKRDTVARLGGDEFVVVMDGPTSAEAVRNVAEHIIKDFAAPFVLNGHTLHMGLSIGLALFPAHGDSPEDLLKNADLAMYRAKERGRNTCDFFTDELNDQVVRRLMVATGLRRALAAGGIEVYYQPKVQGPGSRITGAEALARWRREDGTLIQPADFIPVAEDTGLILPLSDMVLRQACRQAQAWRQAGHRDFTLAVNLSPRQFLHPGLMGRIRDILEETGLPPSALEFEITESTLMNNLPETMATLDALSRLGAAIVLDDFGKEYSSLGYIKKMPIQAIKIDRSFISDLPDDEDDAAIVQTILTMARNLELRVVAEGVETSGQLWFLTNLGCQEFQGYYFSRPLPAAEMEVMLDSLDPFTRLDADPLA